MGQKLDNGAFESAFTVIELLVVIFVIVLLAALLLPSLTSAKFKSQRVICVSNLRQLDQVALAYYQDNGNGWPVDGSGDWIWYRRLGGSKIALADVRICPVARLPWNVSYIPGTPRQGDNPGTAGNCWSMPNSTNLDPQYDYTGSYALNDWFRGLMSRDSENCFLSEASIQNPAFTPVFCDAIWTYIRPRTNDFAPYDLFLGGDPYLGTSGGWLGCAVIARHGSKGPGSAPRYWPSPLPKAWGINVGFADGHVQIIKLPDLWSLNWNRTWTPESPPR